MTSLFHKLFGTPTLLNIQLIPPHIQQFFLLHVLLKHSSTGWHPAPPFHLIISGRP